MKKIMFSDAFFLTKAVLGGTKTMTRRIVSPSIINSYDAWYEEFLYKRIGEEPYQTLEEYIINSSEYKIGEVVAISQSYKAVFEEKLTSLGNPKANEWWYKAIRSAIVPPSKIAGYKNKMFVRADLMPHHIKITDIKAERLQDISDVKVERLQSITDDDIMCEGIYRFGKSVYAFERKAEGYLSVFPTAREAFASLIDKISGKGIWERNPWVVAYVFELVD